MRPDVSLNIAEEYQLSRLVLSATRQIGRGLRLPRKPSQVLSIHVCMVTSLGVIAYLRSKVFGVSDSPKNRGGAPDSLLHSSGSVCVVSVYLDTEGWREMKLG